MIVVPVSIALIALLLYFAFNSIGQALLILVNIPLALIGGIFALYLTGQYLSVPSSMGFITLFGVAVLNGVVMVESINQRIEDSLLIQDAVFDGAVSRLRPVHMTALTSALGLNSCTNVKFFNAIDFKVPDRGSVNPSPLGDGYG